MAYNCPKDNTIMVPVVGADGNYYCTTCKKTYYDGVKGVTKTEPCVSCGSMYSRFYWEMYTDYICHTCKYNMEKRKCPCGGEYESKEGVVSCKNSTSTCTADFLYECSVCYNYRDKQEVGKCGGCNKYVCKPCIKTGKIVEGLCPECWYDYD